LLYLFLLKYSGSIDIPPAPDDDAATTVVTLEPPEPATVADVVATFEVTAMVL
jgi:hypothetical protein